MQTNNLERSGIVTAAPVRTHSVNVAPEFLDCDGVRTIFNLSRSMQYELLNAGKIRAVLLRKPGNKSGRRLFIAQSIRDYFASLES